MQTGSEGCILGGLAMVALLLFGIGSCVAIISGNAAAIPGALLGAAIGAVISIAIVVSAIAIADALTSHGRN